MLFKFGLRSSLLLIFFTHLLVYAFLFWKRGVTQGRLAARLLGSFLALSALFIFPWMSGFAGWYDAQPYRDFLFYFPFIHALFFGPLLFLYLKSLTNRQFRLRGKDWLHFVPGSLYILWSIVVAVVDQGFVKDYYLMNGESDPDFDRWYSIAWSGSILIYLLISIRYYRRYLVFIQYEFSFADAAGFNWLRNFLYAFSLLTLLSLAEKLLGLFIQMEYIRSWYYFLGFAIITYYIAISAYSASPVPEYKLNFQPALLLEYEEPLLLPPAEADPADDTAWMDQWQAAVTTAMEDHKTYLDPELTLTALAKHLGTNASVLSRVINQRFNCNFNDYINSYRVAEIIRLLKNGSHNQYNLLALAFEAGFNSKSTFNRSFKKVTGVAPKDYLGSLENL